MAAPPTQQHRGKQEAKKSFSTLSCFLLYLEVKALVPSLLALNPTVFQWSW